MPESPGLFLEEGPMKKRTMQRHSTMNTKDEMQIRGEDAILSQEIQGTWVSGCRCVLRRLSLLVTIVLQSRLTLVSE